MICSVTPSFRSFHFSYLFFSRFVNQQSTDLTPCVLSQWTERITSFPALQVFSSLNFLRRVLPPTSMDIYHMPFLDPTVWIQTTLRDFANIFVCSLQTFWSTHSQISIYSSTCLFRRWTTSHSLELFNSSTPLYTKHNFFLETWVVHELLLHSLQSYTQFFCDFAQLENIQGSRFLYIL
jgi:hypothetical protein